MKFNLNIDYSLWWRAFVKMMIDATIPILISASIVLYGHFLDEKLLSPFAILGTFFKTLFFVWSYFAILQRSKKLVVDEINHKNVVGKQDAVLTRLENLADDLAVRQSALITKLEGITNDLVGHSTGGNSFAYIAKIEPFFWTPTALKSEQLILDVGYAVIGKYPLRDLTLGISHAEREDMRIAIMNSRGGGTVGELMEALKPDLQLHLGYALPSSETVPSDSSYVKTIAVPFPVPNTKCIRLRCRWNASNGGWTQFIQFTHVGDRWSYATRVHKEGNDLYSFHTENYPTDENNKPILDQ